MGKNTDNDLKKALAKMIEGFERDKIAAEERELKRLWQPLQSPISFQQTLERLTKDELTRICHYHDIKNVSSLKKAPLISELIKILPKKVAHEVKLMDEERYLLLSDLLGKNIDSLTLIKAEDFTTEEIKYWRETGFIFSATYEKQKVIFMPLEIANAFRNLENETTQKIIERNTEWITLTQGMLYYYGVMGFQQILLRLQELTGITPDYLEVHNILLSAKDYYGFITLDSYGRWAYMDVQDTELVYKEQKNLGDVNYRKFSKKKLLEACEPDYYDESPAFLRFVQFLNHNYKMGEKKAKKITYECQQLIQQDHGTNESLKSLETRIEIPDLEFAQRLTHELVHLSNHTRRWILKGYTPNELSPNENENETEIPLPFGTPLTPLKNSFPVQKPTHKLDNVVNIKNGQKIGRNDPCPCGSGKKFKQCCGKS